MLTLSAAQASTWGYSVKNYSIPNTIGGGSNLPAITKPVMAFNGNIYCITTGGGANLLTVEGVTQPRAIIKITPGTTNTGTTNWSAATFSYIYPDLTVTTDANGFAKSAWPVEGQNASVEFSKGTLAANGLIYWAPVTASNFVIFNPVTETWKLSNIHPDRIDATTSLAHKIHSCVLGNDGKIYVIPNLGGKLYRIVTSVNATADTWEQGYWTGASTTSGMGIGNTDMTYYDSTGTLQTDTSTNVNGTTITRAYDKAGGNTGQKTSNHIADVIMHPTGRIYIIPNVGRGRIFYINTNSDWSTNKQIVSTAGLTISNASGVNKSPNFAYAFLEKPRNPEHSPSSLKIYLMPTCKSIYLSPNLYDSINYELMYIDPVTNTLNEIPMNFTYSTSANQYQTGTRISLANGLNITINLAGTTGTSPNRGGAVLTGIDVPSTDTDGAYIIKKDPTRTGLSTIPGILALQNIGILTSPEPGQIQTNIKGGINIPYPHHSKYILNTGGDFTAGGFVEVVSVKQYGNGITNFNYVDRDKAMYQLPASAGLLQGSLYNSNFNK